MTNEALAALIQQGERERMIELWEQNRGLCYRKAQKVAQALEAQGRCDAGLEDLMQAGYLALVDAVEQYDPEAGFKFSTIYTTRLKSHFAEATGYRSKRQQREPLHLAGSLDAPLGGEADGDTLEELVADPVDPYEAVNERLYREWLRDFLNGELEKLPPEQEEVLRLRYYRGMTLEEAGRASGTHRETARQREHAALRSLRRSRGIQRLHLDERTDFYRGGQDPVAANVLWRETLTEEWERRHDSSISAVHKKGVGSDSRHT